MNPLCRNPPFTDGNNRIAFAALGVTLGLNGRYLDASESDATEVMLRLAAGDPLEPEFKGRVDNQVAGGDR